MLSKKPEEFNSWQGEAYQLQTSLRISAVSILFLYTPDTHTHRSVASHTREKLVQLCKLPTGQFLKSRLLVGQLVTWPEMKKTEVKVHLHSKRQLWWEFWIKDWHWWSTVVHRHRKTSAGIANGKCPINVWPAIDSIELVPQKSVERLNLWTQDDTYKLL